MICTYTESWIEMTMNSTGMASRCVEIFSFLGINAWKLTLTRQIVRHKGTTASNS
uniref:Uncharacterized protein n=1 Tax=Arundo donax TaxID=35708 RepID=A0A0A9BVM4_ARUDO